MPLAKSIKGRAQPNLGNRGKYKTPGPQQLPTPKPTPSQLQESLTVKKSLPQSPHRDHEWEREFFESGDGVLMDEMMGEGGSEE